MKRYTIKMYEIGGRLVAAQGRQYDIKIESSFPSFR